MREREETRKGSQMEAQTCLNEFEYSDCILLAWKARTRLPLGKRRRAFDSFPPSLWSLLQDELEEGQSILTL